jgi:flavin reductase (DIM6/NTAB) family NADH-FMN oxidoreductase RutF
MKPLLVGCVVSGNDFSFAALVATCECVLNMPTVELAKRMK